MMLVRRQFYAVLVYRDWETILINGQPLRGGMVKGCVGYFPIFDSLANASEWRNKYAEGCDVMKVEETI